MDYPQTPLSGAAARYDGPHIVAPTPGHERQLPWSMQALATAIPCDDSAQGWHWQARISDGRSAMGEQPTRLEAVAAADIALLGLVARGRMRLPEPDAATPLDVRIVAGWLMAAVDELRARNPAADRSLEDVFGREQEDVPAKFRADLDALQWIETALEPGRLADVALLLAEEVREHDEELAGIWRREAAE